MKLKWIMQRDVKNVFATPDGSGDLDERITWYPKGDLTQKRTIYGQVFGSQLEGIRDQQGDGRTLKSEHVTIERQTLTVFVPVSEVWVTGNDHRDVFEFESYPGTWTFKRVVKRDVAGLYFVVVRVKQYERRRGTKNE